MKALQQGQARSRSVGRAVDWSVSRDNHTRRVRLLQYNTAQYEYRTTSTASTTTQYVRVRVRHQIRAGDTRQEQRLDWPTARLADRPTADRRQRGKSLQIPLILAFVRLPVPPDAGKLCLFIFKPSP